MEVIERRDVIARRIDTAALATDVRCALEYVALRAELGIRAEVWCSWRHTDEVGSRLVHVVTEDTRPVFDEMLAYGGRRAEMLAEVLP